MVAMSQTGRYYTKMENTTKLTLGAIITLMLAVSGTYFLAQGDDAYYCEAKDMVMVCEKLSSGVGTRCYYEDTYKICKEGWEKIEVGQELKDVTPAPPSAPVVSGIRWQCSPKSCIQIE